MNSAPRASARLVARVLAAVLGLALVTACSPGDGLGAMRPASVGADRWEMSAVFDDALNLPRGATVKLGGVVIGQVVGIEAADYRAKVKMAIDDEVKIPADSRFRLRYTTGLGEVYVDITPGRRQALKDGAFVDTAATSVAPTVEDSLASASLLVNGGSLGQIQTIVHELNDALTGRVGATKGMLTQTDNFLAQVLDSTGEIDRLLRSLRGASVTLNRRERTIDRALHEIRPAARSLERSTDDLARLLRRTDSMAVTADRLVTRTRSDLTVVINELGPVLEELVGIEGRLVPSLDMLADFAHKIDAASPTDYLNLKFSLRVDNPSTGDGPGGSPIPDLPLPPLPLPDITLPNLPQGPDPSLFNAPEPDLLSQLESLSSLWSGGER